MKFKLDENIDRRIRSIGPELDLDVDTVVDEGLGGKADPDVVASATREGRFLITLDRGLGDTRSYPPGTHAGIAVLRLDAQDTETMGRAVREFLSRPDLEELDGCVVVARGDDLRVQRPR